MGGAGGASECPEISSKRQGEERLRHIAAAAAAAAAAVAEEGGGKKRGINGNEPRREVGQGHATLTIQVHDSAIRGSSQGAQDSVHRAGGKTRRGTGRVVPSQRHNSQPPRARAKAVIKIEFGAAGGGKKTFWKGQHSQRTTSRGGGTLGYAPIPPSPWGDTPHQGPYPNTAGGDTGPRPHAPQYPNGTVSTIRDVEDGGVQRIQREGPG